MMRPEHKSDIIDMDIANYARKDYRRRRWINIFLGLILILNIWTLIVIYAKANDTNEVVKSQIPGLQQTIDTRDREIAQKDDIIVQAVEAIKRLAQQVIDLGGDPGQITISPR